jgi:hypothetical protein
MWKVFLLATNLKQFDPMPEGAILSLHRLNEKLIAEPCAGRSAGVVKTQGTPVKKGNCPGYSCAKWEQK